MRLAVCLLFLLFTSGFAKKPFGVKRLIAYGSDTVIPNQQPIPPVGLYDLVDAGQVRTRSLPFNSNVTINLKKNYCLNFYEQFFGLSTTNAIYNPIIGMYNITGIGLIVPYCQIPPVEHPARLMYDSKHPERQGEWVFVEAGWIFYATHPGAYGGTRAPYTRFAGDIIVCSDYTFVAHGKDWSKPQNRETLKAETHHVGRQIVNGAGALDTMSNVDVTDEYGNVGSFRDVMYRNRLPNNNWDLQNGNVVIFY